MALPSALVRAEARDGAVVSRTLLSTGSSLRVSAALPAASWRVLPLWETPTLCMLDEAVIRDREDNGIGVDGQV